MKALLQGQADNILKIEATYKSNLGNIIKLEMSLFEKSSRLEAFLDVERYWNAKRGVMVKRLRDVKTTSARR